MDVSIIFGTLLTITTMVIVMALHARAPQVDDGARALVMRVGVGAIAFSILVGAAGIYLTARP